MCRILLTDCIYVQHLYCRSCMKKRMLKCIYLSFTILVPPPMLMLMIVLVRSQDVFYSSYFLWKHTKACCLCIYVCVSFLAMQTLMWLDKNYIVSSFLPNQTIGFRAELHAWCSEQFRRVFCDRHIWIVDDNAVSVSLYLIENDVPVLFSSSLMYRCTFEPCNASRKCHYPRK